jgi:hypothetical protein
MGRSLGFGSTACDFALIRLGFPSAPAISTLTRPHTVTRRLILQEARYQALHCCHCPLTACKHTVSGSATPLVGVLLTFPSRYLFTIGRFVYLGLWSGLHRFIPDFSCPVLLRILFSCFVFRLHDYHVLWYDFPEHFD